MQAPGSVQNKQAKEGHPRILVQHHKNRAYGQSLVKSVSWNKRCLRLFHIIGSSPLNRTHAHRRNTQHHYVTCAQRRAFAFRLKRIAPIKSVQLYFILKNAFAKGHANDDQSHPNRRIGIFSNEYVIFNRVDAARPAVKTEIPIKKKLSDKQFSTRGKCGATIGGSLISNITLVGVAQCV